MKTIWMAWWLLVASLRAAEPVELAGEWSAESHRIQMRLVSRYETHTLEGKPGGDYSQWIIFLELRHADPPLGTTDVLLTVDTATNIVYRVTDAQGKALEPEFPGFRSTFWQGERKLLIPSGGFVRCPISLNGAGVTPGVTKLDVSFLQGIWYLGPTNSGPFYLSGTLKLPRKASNRGPGEWEGTLKIPPVKLERPPVKAP